MQKQSICRINELLERCGFDERVGSIKEVSVSMLVCVFEALFFVRISDIVRSGSPTIADQVSNAAALLDVLGVQVLGVDLSHISPRALAVRDPRCLCDIISILWHTSKEIDQPQDDDQPGEVPEGEDEEEDGKVDDLIAKFSALSKKLDERKHRVRSTTRAAAHPPLSPKHSMLLESIERDWEAKHSDLAECGVPRHLRPKLQRFERPPFSPPVREIAAMRAREKKEAASAEARGSAFCVGIARTVEASARRHRMLVEKRLERQARNSETKRRQEAAREKIESESMILEEASRRVADQHDLEMRYSQLLDEALALQREVLLEERKNARESAAVSRASESLRLEAARTHYQEELDLLREELEKEVEESEIAAKAQAQELRKLDRELKLKMREQTARLKAQIRSYDDSARHRPRDAPLS